MYGRGADNDCALDWANLEVRATFFAGVRDLTGEGTVLQAKKT